jgi:hypothetical protein
MATDSNYMGGYTSDWKIISVRIPPAEHRKLIQRYPERGKVSKVLRALIQMHLAGKVKDLEFQLTQKI